MDGAKMTPSQNSYAIFAVDPGQTTGIATALIDSSQPTVAACMRRAQRKGLINTYEMNCPWYEQAWRIAHSFYEFLFTYHIEREFVIAKHSFYVTESFEIRTMAADLTSRDINAAVEVLLRASFGGREINEMGGAEYEHTCSQQSPSEAKGFCSITMLKDWKLYKKSDHENSALQHIARRVDRLLEGER